MAKIKTMYECTECGLQQSKWFGRCPDCGEWNTAEEKTVSSEVKKNVPTTLGNITGQRQKPKKLREVESKDYIRIKTGIDEIDKLFGGGIVQDSVNILSSPPGGGKSSLCAMLSQNIAKQGKTVLYVSGEESEKQVKLRCNRFFGEDIHDNIYFTNETCVDFLKDDIKEIKPSLIIIDSIQTLFVQELLPKRAGGITQISASTEELIKVCKGNNIAAILISQVTKDDTLRGGRDVEHAVDTCIVMERDEKSTLVMAHCTKARFADTNYCALMVMTGKGLLPADPSMFYTKRSEGIIGCAYTSSIIGIRPIVTEVQSLVDQTVYPTPIRTPKGITKPELQLICTILEKRAGISLNFKDVYTQITGGLKIDEPAVMLSVLMAIGSSATDKEIPSDVAFLGELSLTGEIMKVSNVERRIEELSRLGFKKVYIPKGNLNEKITSNIEIIEINNVLECTNMVFNENNRKRKLI